MKCVCVHAAWVLNYVDVKHTADIKPVGVDSKQLVDSKPVVVDTKPSAVESKQVSKNALEAFHLSLITVFIIVCSSTEVIP